MGDNARAQQLSDAYDGADWHRRVVGRALDGARRRSIDRGARLIRAAADVLERTNGLSLTVQEVAEEAGQSLRTLYQYFESKDDLLLAVFEEAMLTYEQLIRAAIADVEDPVQRLAAGLIASVRIPALHHKAGLDRGLSLLRLQLGLADPALLARSQAPVTALFRGLVSNALAASTTGGIGADQATYLLSTLRTAFTLSSTLGNDLIVEVPDAVDMSWFCLGGLGIQRPRRWHVRIEERLELDEANGRSVLRQLAR